MSEFGKSFWRTYLMLAGLVLVRFVPLAVGTKWLWGVGHLTLLPVGYLIGYGLLGAVTLALPFVPHAESWGESTADWFNQTFYESKSKYHFRALILLFFGATFILFRMPTHFLGDGYTYLSNVGSSVGHWIKWSEGGALLLTMWLQRLVGPDSVASALLAFQIVSVVAGLITLWFFFLIAEAISADPIKRLVTFVALTISGALLLFFGYVESYPILWGPISGFLYFSIRYANEGKGLLGCLVCLLLGIGLHLQAVIFLPAVLYLILSRGKGHELYRRFKPLIWGALVLATIAAGALFYHECDSNLFFENIFLFPFSGKPIAPGYAIFSPSHLSDMLNLFVLVVPLGLLLLSLIRQERRSNHWRRTSVYLALLSAGSLLFLLVVDPSLTMPRDWDLFSLCWLSPGLWLLHLIPGRDSGELRRTVIPILLVAVISAAPFFLVNLNTQRGVAEIEQIIDNNPEKSLGTMSILSNYLGTNGDLKAAEAVTTKMAVTHPEFYRMKSAYKLLGAGKPDEAFQIFSSIKPDQFSREYHAFLAQYYLRTGKPDSGLIHAQLAVQLQKYVDVNYVSLAFGYKLNGKPNESLEALRQGYALNSRNRELIMSLGLIHFDFGRFDSTLYYATRYREVDSSDASYHYLAAMGYCGLRNHQMAAKEAELYYQFGAQTPNYSENRHELQSLLLELEQGSKDR